jgi:tetratricopeptide (TPR) repeat protein
MNKIAINKIQAKVRELITGGYLEDALNESEQLSFRYKDRLALTNLEAQLNQAKADLHAEKLNNDDYSIRINRITNALLELIDKALVEENESTIDKTIAFFKRFWVFIGGLGVVIALLSDSKSILEGCKSFTKNDSIVTIDSLDCGFPKKFKDDSLYILITAFENDAQRFSSDCFGQSLLRRIDAKKMPIKICYRPDLSPKQRDEVKRLQTKYNADLILWGNLKNLSQNCGEGDICFKSLPSDTIIKICGGQIETEKSNLNYEKGISSEDIEQGALHIGDLAFDSWIVAVFNAKVGKKKPDFFVVDESLSKEKQSDSWKEKGELYHEFKDVKKSIECYNLAININPKNAYAFIGRGIVKVNIKDYKGAISDYDTGIKLYPKMSELVYVVRGLIKEQIQDKEGAIIDYSIAIKINSNYVDAYIYRGDLMAEMKDTLRALVNYDSAIILQPNNSDSYIQRGSLKTKMKDYKRAIADYDKAIILQSDNTDSYIQRGNLKTEMKDYKGAIVDYDSAIILQPNNSDSYTQRGNLKKAMKDFKGAIVDYNKAIIIHPNSIDAYLQKGDLKTEIKDFKGAITEYDKALKLDTTVGKSIWKQCIFSQRGYAKAKNNDFIGATVDFDKLIEFDPNNPSIYLIRGSYKFNIKNYESAIIDFNKVIQLSQKNLEPYRWIAMCRKAQKDYKDAIKYYDNIIRLDSDSQMDYFYRGYCKAEINDFKNAIVDYDKAIQIDTTQAAAYYNRGIAYEAIKEKSRKRF